MTKQKYLIPIIVIVLTFTNSAFASGTPREVTGGKTFVPMNIIMHFNALSQHDREKYILHLYLKARETYQQENYDHNYHDFVRLYSADKVYNAFKASLENGANLDSPLLLGANERILRVKSLKISPPESSASYAVIDFVSEDIDKETGSRFNTREKTAKIKFAPLNIGKMTVNSLNPYNFQVLDYQISNGKE
ncbi:MAG: type IV secretion system protein [Rickettsiales bacterium]|nr:type IV secretion system protein [Pseudomonadota bacterium]MDA0965846.1 type IV secretion system protein [Pseudomonadota bacterium]MDG4542684.1 type IV secretion system protein [Rickettsiales bacterium]MDG4545188.1 type IV secretion system protein [Rickettsiales bacterium]MDG4547311.1 type IV secretion system protein [Rickettsiales bacterium]